MIFTICAILYDNSRFEERVVVFHGETLEEIQKTLYDSFELLSRMVEFPEALVDYCLKKNNSSKRIISGIHNWQNDKMLQEAYFRLTPAEVYALLWITKFSYKGTKKFLKQSVQLDE